MVPTVARSRSPRGCCSVALVWLVYANVSTGGLLIFAVIYGLDFIATVPPTVRLSVQTFGPEIGPAVFSWIFAAHHLSAGATLFAAGVSRDMIGTYVPAFLLAGILCFVAAASFGAVRKPRPVPAALG